MNQPRKLKKRLTGAEKFRELIDYYYAVDDMYKLANDERERVRKQLIRMIRYGHRGYGIHAGEERAINSYVVRRRQFSQTKARELMGLKLFNRAFKTQKYVQVDALESPNQKQAQETIHEPPSANPPDSPAGPPDRRDGDGVSD